MCRLFSFRNHRISMSFLPRAPFSQKLAAVEAAHHRGFVRWLGRPYGSSQDGSGYHETPAMDLGYRNWALSVACVPVYIHIYMFICACKHARAHTHIYIYNIHTYIHACMHAYIHTYIFTYLLTCLLIYLHL